MRAVFGLLLIMLGLAMAVVWMPEHHGGRQLAVVTEIAVKGSSPPNVRVTDEERSVRSFSPSTPLIVSRPVIASRELFTSVASSSVTQGSIQPASAPMQRGETAPSIVQLPVVATASVLRSAESMNLPQPQPEMVRDELVRHIQRELKRVGCYSGDVDGDWGTGSRRAMGMFTDRVNASLPIGQPDFILLTLLRGYAGSACGKVCSGGQTLSESGRCVPMPAVARRDVDRRPSAAREEVREEAATTTASAISTLPSSPLAAGAVAAAAGAAGASSWAQRQAQAPLPGRMSIGGPAGTAAATASARPNSPPSAASEAVRDNSTMSPGRSASRERSRGAGRRAGAARVAGFAYRPSSVGVYRPQVAAYRAAAPRSYAPARRAGGSRSWTATFFSNP